MACYCLLAEIAVHQGRFEEVRRFLDEAGSMAESEANQSLLIETLRVAFVAMFNRQDFTTAYRLSQQRLNLCRSVGHTTGEADAHMHLAQAATQLFRIEEARRHFAEAATLYHALGDRRGQAAVLLNAGLLATRLGQYAQEIESFRQAEALFKELNDLRGQTVSALNIADTARFLGDYTAAKAAALRGLELARAMKSLVYEANALAGLGAAERELGELPAAITHMEAGLALRRQLDQPANLGADLCDLTIAYLRAGNLPAARQAAGEMLAIYDAAADHMLHPEYILWASAQTYHALGEPDRAQALLEQAHAVLQKAVAAIPDPESRATILRLPFNRELLAACERGAWPDVSRSPNP